MQKNIQKELWRLLRRYKYLGMRFLWYRFLDVFPFFPSRVQDYFQPRLTSRFISNQLITLFNGKQGHGANLHRKDFIGLGLVHYSLIRMIKPKRVLCIGSLRGYIPAICSLACLDNGRGIVDFVDAGYGEENDASWGADGFWRKNNPDQHFNKLKLRTIKTYVMTTAEFVRKYPQRRYHYIYVDGDHTYEGVKSDYTLLWPFLEPGGFMSFHDILGKGYIGNAQFGVKKFWKELSSHHKVSLFHPQKSGLGILQKET